MYQKNICICALKTIIFLVLFLFSSKPCQATGVYLDFNDFPITTGTVPGNSTNWEYSSSVTNNYGYTESLSSGWKSKTKLSDGWHWFFDTNRNGKCNTHLGGGDTYGYLDITQAGHIDKALRNYITGGIVAIDGGGTGDILCPAPLGTQIYNKESFTVNTKICTTEKVGHSYITFKKIEVIGSTRNTSPYSLAIDSNRFSLYVFLPPSTTNGVGGYGHGVEQTYQIGIFQDPLQTGYHHYHNYYTQGGGWAKIQIEETTNGDNGGNGATRYIPNFLKTIWQFYLTSLPYSGATIPPYEIKIDDIEFSNDNYTPQNNETISNISILYKESSKTWEISFNDKYKVANAYSTYELRYSFNPITNENWSSATPALIIPDTRFYIRERVDGKFQKWWPDTQGVWAPFKLTTTDTNKLTTGQVIYFAVKDVSQLTSDPRFPVDAINGYLLTSSGKGGRHYDTDPLETTFKFTIDSIAMRYIKRISYTIGSSPPAAPMNVRLPQI